jgi:hypothetical protein
MNTGTTRNVMLGLAALTLAAGCAGESASRRADTTTSYQEDFERAAASIAEAEREGANEHGSADLNRAREKLNAARRAAEDGNGTLARRLAVEADLDADVALATERNAEAQAAVDDLRENIRTLEEELRRSEARGAERL